MKNIIKKIVLGCSFLVAICCVANASEIKVTQEFAGKNIVGVTAPGYKPYEFIDASGKLIGLDIDLFNAICKELNAVCELKEAEFDSIVPGMTYGKYDLAIAGINKNAERAKVVLFSDVYAGSRGSTYAVLSDSTNFDKPENLKLVGAQNATIQYTYIKKETKKTVRGYPNINAAILDLKAKRIDSIVADAVTLDEIAKTDHSIKVFTNVIESSNLESGNVIIFNKNNAKLQKAVNEALAKLKNNGTLDTLVKKWIN